MKSWKKILTVGLAGLLTLGFAGCGGDPIANTDYSEAYQYEKTREGMWLAETADPGVGEFITDFYERHIRSGDKQIHNLNLGLGAMFLKDWEAMSLMWANAKAPALNYNGFDNILGYINEIPIDKYGYVWQTYKQTLGANSTDSPWGPNWAFPYYIHGPEVTTGYEFNDNYLEGWTSNTSAFSCSDGLLSAEGTGSTETLEIISPNMGTMRRETSPFINIDFRITPKEIDSEISDIYLYWRREQTEEWSDDRRLSLKEDTSFEKVSFDLSYMDTVYFPCYLHPNYQAFDQIKIEIVPKRNMKVTSKVKLNYVRLDFDARQLNNNAIYLNTLREYFTFTGDRTALEANLNRARSAMLFMTKTLGGEANHLVSQEYFPGHDGVRGTGHGIGNGYWDIVSTPYVSFYANVFYVKALNAMIYLEEQAAALGIQPETNAYIFDGFLSGEKIEWDYTLENLQKMRTDTLTQIRKPFRPALLKGEEWHFNYEGGFWNEETGRFLEGVNTRNEVMDYGFVSFNLEAICEDIPTAEQAKSIMDWISGERIVPGDDAQGKYGDVIDEDGYVNSTGTKYGIYDFRFAPRTTTRHNSQHYVWSFGAQNYGNQVQDGGAIMYVSYYDIMARLKVYGADNAMGRLKEIQAWYNDVQEEAERAGVGDSMSSTQFYRVYYRERGIPMQGGGTAGAVGLDFEFLEASLFYACIPKGFFGLEGSHDTLTVSPVMTKRTGYMKMENMMFDSVRYDVIASRNFVQVASVYGNTRGKKIRIELDRPGENFQVYINSKATDDYIVQGDKIVVTVDFKAVKVAVK